MHSCELSLSILVCTVATLLPTKACQRPASGMVVQIPFVLVPWSQTRLCQPWKIQERRLVGENRRGKGKGGVGGDGGGGESRE